MADNTETHKLIRDHINTLLNEGSPPQFAAFFTTYHEVDIADALEGLSHQQISTFFTKIKPEIGADIIEEMEPSQQKELLTDLKTELAAQFLVKMEPDDAVDALETLVDQKAETLIKALPQKRANELRELLSYTEDSAGAIMTSNFISIPENLSVKEALLEVQRQNPPDSEVSYYVYVTNSDQQLQGFTTLRNIIMSPPSSKIKEIRNNNPISTRYDTDQEEVAKICQKYNLLALPVVDDDHHLIGLVTIDDVVDIVVEEATEDIYILSGTATENIESELLSGNIISAIKYRLPWLIITILGGLIASMIITFYADKFESRSFSLALSLSFVPLLIGLAGNVGNQSATIIVRGLATGHIKKHQIRSIISREIIIGFSIGILIALVLFVFNMFNGITLILALIISASIASNILVAAIIGAGLPALFETCNIDPAVASAPFISTALDIIGQIIYFSLTIGTLTLLLL